MLHSLSAANPKQTSCNVIEDTMSYGVLLRNSSNKNRFTKAGRVARRPKTKQLLTKEMESDRLLVATESHAYRRRIAEIF